MKLYRIYTEDVASLDLQEQLTEELTASFSGYTILRGIGVWNRQVESALIIEIVTEENSLVYVLAESIRKLLKQHTVLVVAQDITATFLH